MLFLKKISGLFLLAWCLSDSFRFLCTASTVRSFLLLSNVPLDGCTAVFIHSTVEGHLGRFQVLITLNKSSVPVSLEGHVHWALTFLDICSEVERLGPRAMACWSLSETASQSSHVAARWTAPQWGRRGRYSSCCTSSPELDQSL